MKLIKSGQKIENNRFADEDSANKVEGTILSAEWLNAVQDELVGLATMDNSVLDETNSTQAKTVISAQLEGALREQVGRVYEYPIALGDDELVSNRVLPCIGQKVRKDVYPLLWDKFNGKTRDQDSITAERLSVVGEFIYIPDYINKVVNKDLFTTLNNPSGIAIDSQGNIYVTQYSSGNVIKWDDTTKTEVMTGLNNPHGIAIDSHDNIYVTEFNSDKVTKWDGDTKTPIISGLNSPYAIAIDSKDNIYVTQYSSGNVIKWDDTTKTEVISGLNSPYAIAIDSKDNIYVAENSIGKVTKWDGSTKTTIISGLNYPRGIAIDSHDNIYVTEFYSGNVIKWDDTTKTPIITGLNYPYGMAIDAHDNIYVTEYYSAKVKYHRTNPDPKIKYIYHGDVL